MRADDAGTAWWRTRAALGLAALALAGCQYMPHAYEPHSAQIPDSRTIPVQGAILTFTSLGSGQPVVFIHGNIADLRIWNAQQGPAFKRYQLVAYSRRYHYPNAWTGNGTDYTEANHLQDLLGLLHGLNLSHVHLVGEGAGAQLAVEVALAHPELVRTLVLVEPDMAAAAVQQPDFATFTNERAQLQQQVEMQLRLQEAEKGARLYFDWANASTGAYDALPAPLKGEILDNASILGFFFSAPPPAMPCAELARLTVPTLVVTGERTNFFYAAVGESVAGCIPNAVREVVPMAAHVVQRENPDAFNATLVGFLALH